MSGKASIVIPTFNRAHLIRRAIESALAQTVACEVIVCDHGSTDNTREVVATFGGQVKYLYRTKDDGPFHCWLDGLLFASSEYVHLTYDDDWLSPTFIEECLKLMQDNCAYVFSRATIEHRDGSSVPCLDYGWKTGLHSAVLIERVLIDSPLAISPGCAVFRRRDAVQSLSSSGVPFGRSAYHGAGPDMLMFLLPLIRYPQFGYVNRPLAHFFAHEGSITIDSDKSAEKSLLIRGAYIDAKRYYLLMKDGFQSGRADALLQRLQLKKALGSIVPRVKSKAQRLLGIAK